ncbi:MAG: hypothetical protein NT166_16305 [Candidatus Aminicenantes bacterium]|nr:hypothetical protein [Candidatus Aminicenantes bacterium]
MNPILLEDFFKLRPRMFEKYEYPGSFRDFARDIAGEITPRKQEVSVQDSILNQVRRVIGGVGAISLSPERLDRQLSQYPVISYADHHGLLNYKLLYNSNLLYGEIAKELKLPFAVVLAAGNVPLDNMSYPRGFYFKKRKFNFFGAEESRSPVFLFEKKLRVDRRVGIDGFITGEARGTLTAEEKKFLDFLFFDCLEIEKAAGLYDAFSDQITFLNYKLWQYYFDKSLRDSIPRLIYLPSNTVVLDILCREIMNKDSLISLILFDAGVRRVFLRNFSGTAGCWGENSGSHLFWGVSQKKKYKRLIRLSVDDTANSLVGEGENFSLALERETLVTALKAKKILPTLFFDYLIMTFLGGYLTLGGFNQLDYLPQMQRAHIKSLQEIGMHDLADRFSSRVTNGLVCGMIPCEFDSGIDLIWHYNSHNGKFNGNLELGLTRDDLDRILDMKVRDMILSAVETMLENVSVSVREKEGSSQCI